MSTPSSLRGAESLSLEVGGEHHPEHRRELAGFLLSSAMASQCHDVASGKACGGGELSALSVTLAFGVRRLRRGRGINPLSPVLCPSIDSRS